MWSIAGRDTLARVVPYLAMAGALLFPLACLACASAVGLVMRRRSKARHGRQLAAFADANIAQLEQLRADEAAYAADLLREAASRQQPPATAGDFELASLLDGSSLSE